jgi:type VI secretion system secreted protein Hcp
MVELLSFQQAGQRAGRYILSCIPAAAKSTIRITGLLGVLFLSGSVQAAFEAFLFLPGIPGEATELNHVNWIKVLSLAEGQTNGLTGVRSRFNDITLVKPVDKASPLLLTTCALGRSIANARLQLVDLDSRRSVFYDIQLSHVVVTGISPAQTAPSQGPPTERIALSFDSITWTYTDFGPNGLPSAIQQAYWNIIQNKGGSSSIPAFRVTGIQPAAGQVKLSWEGEAGRTYSILASQNLQGPYSLVTQQTATNNGTVSVTINTLSLVQFYWLESAF